LLNKNFLKMVVMAFIVAFPLSWYAMQKWLMNFAYRTDINIWIFTLSAILALIIAFISVSWTSWRAATRNPVEALRYE
jgi:putative ABC transport system permease protein